MAKPAPRHKERGPARAAAIIILLILVPVGILQYAALTRIRPHPDACGIPNAHPSPVAAPTAKPDELATIDVSELEPTEINFGRDLRVKKVTLRFRIEGEVARPRSVRIREEDFRRSDDARIPPDTIRSRAKTERGELVLELCIDRRNLTALVGRSVGVGSSPATPTTSRRRAGNQRWADPGTYEGTISVVDSRFAPAAIPITVTMSYPVWPHPVLLLYLVVLVASIYLWILRRQLGDDDVVLSAKRMGQYVDWLRTWGGLASVIAGTIGAVTAFNAAYLNVKDFGSSVPQWFGFIGAMFTAFVTVGSTPHIVASRSRGRETIETQGDEIETEEGAVAGVESQATERVERGA